MPGMKPGATPHRFEPESTRELDAVRGLEGAGLRVVLYLTGRAEAEPVLTAIGRDEMVRLPLEPLGEEAPHLAPHTGDQDPAARH